jgi:hypothetical protein
LRGAACEKFCGEQNLFVGELDLSIIYFTLGEMPKALSCPGSFFIWGIREQANDLACVGFKISWSEKSNDYLTEYTYNYTPKYKIFL